MYADITHAHNYFIINRRQCPASLTQIAKLPSFVYLLVYHTVQAVSGQDPLSHGHNSLYVLSGNELQHSPNPQASRGFEYSR